MEKNVIIDGIFEVEYFIVIVYFDMVITRTNCVS